MKTKLSPNSGAKAILWLLAASFYIWTTLATLPRVFAETFPDSGRYFAPTSIFSLENAGIFYSLFVRAFDLFPGIIVAQILVSLVSWLLLSLSVLRLFTGWIGTLAGLGTLAIATQESVTNWNNLILSESVAISMTAFWLATVVWLLKPLETQRGLLFQFCFFLTASLMLMLNRPQSILLILPLGFLLIFVNSGRLNKLTKYSFYSALGIFSIGSAIRLLFLSKGSPFAAAYAQHLVENRIEFTQYALDLAGCESISAISGNTYSDLITNCPNIEQLVNQNGLSFTSWFFAQPLQALNSFLIWLKNDALFVNYSSTPTIIDRDLANKILGVGYPFISIVAFFALFSLGIIALSSILYRSRFSSRRFLLSAAFVLLLFAYVLLSWGIDGIEMPRHSLPVLLFIPLVISGGMLYIFELDKPLLARRKPYN